MTRLFRMEDKRYSLQWYVTKEEDGQTVKQFLTSKGISKRALTDIKFKGGHITVDEIEQNVRYLLGVDEQVKVFFPIEPMNDQLHPENISLHILFEDEHILVINKPSGMSTIPSREHPTGSLANALVHYFLQNTIHSQVHIVTRLDRETSGIVLVAKHRHAHHLLSELQKRFEMTRTYEAFVTGDWIFSHGTINKPIGRKEDSIIEREVRMDGQEAITHFRLLKQYKGFAHLQVNLETGRTHQIRVHMCDCNHPLLGDDLYGGETKLINRVALHCCTITFPHPFTNERMTFRCDLPKDMGGLLQENEWEER